MGLPTVSQDTPAVVCLPLLEEWRHGSLAWDQLLKRSPAASPFAGWAWHWAWANSAPPEDVRTSQAATTRRGWGGRSSTPGCGPRRHATPPAGVGPDLGYRR